MDLSVDSPVSRGWDKKVSQVTVAISFSTDNQLS